MAKMFYTLEEVCEKLGKSEDEIKDMVRTGQIQEFRDRDKLMFKVEQIDLLAGGDEDTSDVHLDLEDTSGGSGIALKDESGIGLADTGGGSGIGLADTGEGPAGSGEGSEESGERPKEAAAESSEMSDSGGIGLADSRESTGVSVFDTDHGSDAGAEQTDSGQEEEEELGLDAVGSGSGLLDLTRESDDTSLGAELLEEVYSGEGDVEMPAAASGLFEAAGAEKPGGEEAPATMGAGANAGMPVLVEAYDGSGSGLGAGLLVGALAALVIAAIVTLVGLRGATPMLASRIAESSIWIWAGGLFGVTVILGLVGLFIGKASE